MLDTILARYRVWQRTLDTIRYLDHCDDHILADMGIERADIAMIARRSAKAEAERRRQSGQVRTRQNANGPHLRAARS